MLVTSGEMCSSSGRRPEVSRLALAAFAALFTFLGACSGDSPTGGAGLSGTFDLATVDGQSLPYLTFINQPGDSLFITGGEVRILSRGRASIVQRNRWHTPSGGPQPEASDTLVLIFRESGDRIVFDYPTYKDTATIDDDALTIRTFVNFGQGNTFHRDMLYYRR